MSAKCVKYLGTNLPVNPFDNLFLFKENFSTTSYENKSIFNIWSSRSLTLLGRITILKILIISKIVYKALHFPIFLPDSFIKDLNQILFRFIWGSRWKNNKIETICCDVKKGANMIDIKCRILSLKSK